MAVVVAVVSGWLIFLGFGTAAAGADNSTVLTESFESVSGLPAGWKFVEYTRGNSTARIVRGAAADGTHFLRIVSSKPNHARVVVPVRVAPNKNYRWQVMVKARGATTNTAAVLGVEGQLTVTDSVRTDTQWQPLDLYVRVGAQTIVELTMGLGHFGQLNVGTADFDGVTLTQVDVIPHGATVVAVGRAAPAAATPKTAAASTFTHGPNPALGLLVGILVVVSVGTAVFLLVSRGPKSTASVDTQPQVDADSDQPIVIAPKANSPPKADPDAGIDSVLDRTPEHVE